MNMTGYDNYQKVYDGHSYTDSGARSAKRLFMMRLNGIEGKRVLDIGCNAGMLAIDAKKRGASYVMGIDRGAVIAVAKEQAKLNMVDVDFKQMDMESDEFKQIAEKGAFDFVYFCAMFDHVRPENRTSYLQFLDQVTNEVLMFETNFERKPKPYLELLNLYTTFDGRIDCGETGDRRASDYHMYRLERNKNEPYEVKNLPTFLASMADVFAPNTYYEAHNQTHAQKVEWLKDSIARNGQVRPCLVKKYDKSGYQWVVKEGVHRYIAMSELGLSMIALKDITGVSFSKRTDT